MQIDHACMADLDGIANLLIQHAHPEGAYRHIPFSEARGRAVMTEFITGTESYVLVAKDAGEVVGVISAMKTPGWWFDGDMVLIFVFYLKPAARKGHLAMRMIRKLMDWALGWQSVKQVVEQTGFGVRDDRVVSLFEYFGFEVVGTNMVRYI